MEVRNEKGRFPNAEDNPNSTPLLGGVVLHVFLEGLGVQAML
jgi:hypothetical protein